MATPGADPVIHVDVQPLLHDSDNTSSTASVTNSILNYRFENGRTYHAYKDGKYYMPNDETENNRLDLQHNLFLLTFDNKLSLSPPNLPEFKTGRVLDLGTGTGIWAINFADEHPETETDDDSNSSSVPPNLKFEIDDIDEDWTYSRPFDYIHSRMMNVSVKNWPENLTPGGYAELQDVDVFMQSDDNTLIKGHALRKWGILLAKAAQEHGTPFIETDRLKHLMAELGFVDVKETPFKWPTNRWPKEKRFKELGEWSNVNTDDLLEGVSMALFTRCLDWTPEEVSVFLVDVRKDLNNPKIHAYWSIRSVYGRKPEA
ncbi:S-adenosyl-L-methionine-dependent methyltransferase [Ilyonectria robusta]|uniref:S-adenosyl-L-methionine-dependent methyltransferase n=1 Tax=Ilyonectria robusta TaxID=1079257 RepID=UPI001E8E2473|nr:S-adenosyl-L-methionine-dependent methyltransferase [Ilyonectria robusta]KAH8654712.1 S-adenosyl-L-methionine-dependent methyltransferase [Ilyonectria robusta]